MASRVQAWLTARWAAKPARLGLETGTGTGTGTGYAAATHSAGSETHLVQFIFVIEKDLRSATRIVILTDGGVGNRWSFGF